MALSGMQVTSNLTSSKWAIHLPNYVRAAAFARVYDAFASPPPGEDMERLWRTSAITFHYLYDLEPGTSAIPESTDVADVAFKEGTDTMTPTSRYGATQVSEALMNSVQTNYAAEKFALLGKNAMETIDLVAQGYATQGTIRMGAARTSLDAGTTADRLGLADFINAGADLKTRKVPMFLNEGREMGFCVIHPYAFADLLADTKILAVGEYQKASIVLQQEMGELAGFKIIVTPWAKVFWGGGAANASAIETTIATSAIAQGAKSMVVASASNIDVGDRVLLGTHETGNTHYATNETVVVTSVDSTTIGFAGEGANGGCRFDHAVGEAVSNDDNVGTCVFGGNQSLFKVWDPAIGEFGTVIGPETTGKLHQFTNLSWKAYFGYARPIETRLVRREVAFSRDA